MELEFATGGAFDAPCLFLRRLSLTTNTACFLLEVLFAFPLPVLEIHLVFLVGCCFGRFCSIFVPSLSRYMCFWKPHKIMNDKNRKQLGVQQHSMVDRTKRRRVITLPMVMVIVCFLFLSIELFPLMERNEMTPMMATLLQTSTTNNNHDRQEPKHQN